MGQSNSRAANPPGARQRERPSPSPWTRRLSRTFDRQLPSHLRSRPQSSMSFSTPMSDPQDAVTAPTPSRRHLRLTRARTSFSLPGIFHRNSTEPQQTEAGSSTPSQTTSQPQSRPASRRAATEAGGTGVGAGAGAGAGPGFWLPRLQVPDLDLNFDSPQPPVVASDIRTSTRSASNITDRISALRPDRGIRSMTHQLRRRRSPPRRDEDQAAMLSRLLSVAAAATAASLMGEDHRAAPSARSMPGESDEGTFDSFLQALQNGRIASALRQNGNDAEDETDDVGGVSAPLNFFRMFRFGSSGNMGTSMNGQGHSHSEDGQSTEDGRSTTEGSGEGRPDGRMVPIIIVGIRSINPNNGAAQDDNNIPPFIDALSNFPAPLAAPGESSIDGVMRQPQNGTRFTHRRRASMGGINNFPSSYDTQRHQRFPEQSRPWSTVSDTSSGPRPPPSTPASPGVSAVSSGSNTPTRAPTSALPSHAPSRRESFIRRATGSGLTSTMEEQPRQRSRTRRQRRLSESDFTRFGSGASRRNGMVEPDTTPSESSRSWIIYVLGGSYPENHPILTTPSLFTDSPTYEDMLLLSALLGPAKPPVASEADVAAAPGLFRISGAPGALIAIAVDGEDRITINRDERCLVCLCDFETDEEARRLVQCGHLFHRECIDQWLTTGRNSCPLCRGQGVDEGSSDAPASAEAGTSRAASTVA